VTGQRGLPQDHGHDVAHRDTDRPRLCRRFGWRWLRRAEYVALPGKFIRRYLLYDRGRWFLAKFKVGDGGVDFGLLLLLPVSDNLGLTRVVFLLCALPLRTFFFRRDNRGQTTVYLIQQTIPPFLAPPLDVAFPTFRARHAAPMPLIPAPRTPHFQAHNFRSSHAGFHRPGPAPVRIETVHDTPLRGSPHPYPVQGTTNAASAANQARLVRCSDNSTSDIPPGARPCPPARDSIRCTADTPADSFLPG